MKGGITSGVVYPFAITELSKQYRFRNIGGTSAGAIGAVFAAAAEYRRQTGGDEQGFRAIEALADELANDMKALFQPSPKMEPLYQLLIASISQEAREKGRALSLLGAVCRAFSTRIICGFSITTALLLLAFIIGGIWAGLFGLLFGLVLTFALVAAELFQLGFKDLPKHDFGICPGRTIGNNEKQGFSDWIADKIDSIAGRSTDGPPLTVGDLGDKEIKIATMSTDLSSARPYQLPLQTNVHFFSRSEFETLFPERIVDYLCETGGARKALPNDQNIPDDLYRLPFGDKFPVLLVARMSLSFPLLIRAVPLWRPDYSRGSGTDAPLRRCLFSDGGISSNFPIHFFDALLPSRPTFGIALGAWEPHHGEERIDLPTKGRQSDSLPVRNVGGIGGFLMAIVNTAKDWQDSMQSLLPGYAERIVTVRLDESREGGLNLTMQKPTIDNLTGYGRQAGEALTEQFSFTQHRFDRAIALLPAMEDLLRGFAKAYKLTADGYSYSEVLREFDTRNYPQNTAEWRADPLDTMAKDLAALGEKAQNLHEDNERESVRQGKVPVTDSQIRHVAIADRVPQRARDAADGSS